MDELGVDAEMSGQVSARSIAVIKRRVERPPAEWDGLEHHPIAAQRQLYVSRSSRGGSDVTCYKYLRRCRRSKPGNESGEARNHGAAAHDCITPHVARLRESSQ